MRLAPHQADEHTDSHRPVPVPKKPCLPDFATLGSVSPLTGKIFMGRKLFFFFLSGSTALFFSCVF